MIAGSWYEPAWPWCSRTSASGRRSPRSSAHTQTVGAARPRDQRPRLRTLALEKLREERFNAEVAATLATLAPRAHRETVVEAIVAYEVMYDYLDRLIEQPTVTPSTTDATCTELHRRDHPRHEPTGDYYPPGPRTTAATSKSWSSVVRGALARLPSTAASPLRREQRLAAPRHRYGPTPSQRLGTRQLEQWARREAQEHRSAGGSSSPARRPRVLAVHALIAAAADERTTPGNAAEIDTPTSRSVR